MSGGEKKMASIATILAMTPDIILMDEPSIALDPRNRRSLIHILNDFEHLKIIASHDLDMILETCSRVILMSGGCIVCDGDAKEILTNQELLEENGLELPFCLQKPVWKKRPKKTKENNNREYLKSKNQIFPVVVFKKNPKVESGFGFLLQIFLDRLSFRCQLR